MGSGIIIDPQRLTQHLSNDTVLHKVNRYFISLQREEVKKNNQYLQEAIKDIINEMKTVNSLFGKTYQTMFFGGSFYKKTKISNPTEFDLNMVIKLPFKEIRILPGPPGFIKLHLPSGYNFTNYTLAEQRILNLFITNEGYLNQERFRAWIEGTITKAIPQLPQINVVKSGPAFTVTLKINDEVKINVDLVPVLQFNKQLPDACGQVRLSKCDSKTWSVVPKPLNFLEYGEANNIYWRLSFYEQEKQILTVFGRTKLLIRLMKKLRDTQGWHSLKSYYIETLFLHELETMQTDFNNKPLTFLFYMMLHKLMTACSNHRINFYWNENCNLMRKMNNAAINIIKNRLYNIINNIHRNIGKDKYIIAKYILNPIEYVSLQVLSIASPLEEDNAANEESSCRIL